MAIPLKPLRTIEPGSVFTSEFEDRKSVFYGYVAHVESEEEAVDLRHQVMAEIPAASHYVSAYILRDSMIEFFSDAKEPHGTAGMPVLNVLKGHELEDSVAIVARVFGGTLLGKGGLMRAYTKAAQMAVEEAKIVVKTPCRDLLVSIEYSLYETLMAQLANMRIQVLDKTFADDVTLDLRVMSDECDVICDHIVNMSCGRAEIFIGDEQLSFIDIPNLD